MSGPADSCAQCAAPEHLPQQLPTPCNDLSSPLPAGGVSMSPTQLPAPILVLFAAEQSPFFQLHVAHKIMEARLWWGYGASPKPVPYRSLYIPSPRQQRGWDFMFRLCPESNRHQHYSFPFLFLQGGMSVGLRKVCKGLTVPPWCYCFIFPFLPCLPPATTLTMAKSLTL